LCTGAGMSSVYWTGAIGSLFNEDWFVHHFAVSDAILLSMPALVFVLALSGGIHLVNYYHDAIMHRGKLKGSVSEALRSGLTPCFLASLTTAIGLGSLVASTLIPIQKFGFYSALGVLLSLFFLFYYLPAVLHLFPSREFLPGGKKYTAGEFVKESGIHKFWMRVSKVITRKNRLVTVIALLVLTFCAVGLTRIESSVKLLGMFESDAKIVKDYAWLEDNLGPLVPLDVMVQFDNRSCHLTNSQRLKMVYDLEYLIENSFTDKKSGENRVGGALSAATMAAPEQIPKPEDAPKSTKDLPTEKDPVKRLQIRYDTFDIVGREMEKLFVENRPLLSDFIHPDRLKGDERIAAAIQAGNIPTLAQVIPPNDRETEQAVKVLAVCKKAGVENLKVFYEKIIKLRKEEAAKQVSTKKEPFFSTTKKKTGLDPETIKVSETIKVTSLSPKLATDLLLWHDQFREKLGNDVWRVAVRVPALAYKLDYSQFVGEIKERVDQYIDQNYLNPTLTEEEKEAGAAPIEGIEVKVTGIPSLVFKSQHELIGSLFKSLLLAFVLIAIVMTFVLRSPLAGLISMIPNLFPVIIVFGAMGWMGIDVDVGTMMTASVALGVAVDDTIHFLTWFRRGFDEAHDRKTAVKIAYDRCAVAMTQTTVIAGLGMGIFSFSSFIPSQRFGMMMLVMLFMAVIGDLFFLPAILAGPVGKVFERKAKKRMEKENANGNSDADENPEADAEKTEAPAT